MNFGWDQVVYIGREDTYGVAVNPVTPLGIVIGGSLQENIDLDRERYEYGNANTSGSARFIVQNLSMLNEFLYIVTALPSYTIAGGVGGARAYVGSKISSVKLSLTEDFPFTAEISWESKYVTDYSISSYTYNPAPLLSLNGSESILSLRGEADYIDIYDLSINIGRDLNKKYLTSEPDELLDSGPTYIVEGKREIVVEVTTPYAFSSVIRGIPSSSSECWLASEFIDQIEGGKITFQAPDLMLFSIEEPIVPNDLVLFKYGFKTNYCGFS